MAEFECVPLEVRSGVRVALGHAHGDAVTEGEGEVLSLAPPPLAPLLGVRVVHFEPLLVALALLLNLPLPDALPL